MPVLRPRVVVTVEVNRHAGVGRQLVDERDLRVLAGGTANGGSGVGPAVGPHRCQRPGRQHANRCLLDGNLDACGGQDLRYDQRLVERLRRWLHTAAAARDGERSAHGRMEVTEEVVLPRREVARAFHSRRLTRAHINAEECVAGRVMQLRRHAVGIDVVEVDDCQRSALRHSHVWRRVAVGLRPGVYANGRRRSRVTWSCDVGLVRNACSDRCWSDCSRCKNRSDDYDGVSQPPSPPWHAPDRAMAAQTRPWKQRNCG